MSTRGTDSGLSTLIIRFSSLGDVVLTAAVTAAVGNVIFVTHRRYADLARRLPGVKAVVALEPGESVSSLARRIPPSDRVVDLHGSARSRALCLLLGRTVQRLSTKGFARRMRVAMKAPERIETVVERYCEAAGVPVPAAPWLPLPRRGPAGGLGIVPMAAHANKRWPVRKWVGLVKRWEGPVWALGGPGEAAALREIQTQSEREIEVVAENGFGRTFEVLESVSVVVGGDTGLMHLAAVCGVPVVGIYGPTTSSDGFWCHPGIVVEEALSCRPCTRYGGAVCPIGDHACMEEIAVEAVLSAIQKVLDPVGSRVVQGMECGELEERIETAS